MEEKAIEKESEIKSIEQKLLAIQTELNVPKSKWNKFGEFYYRSCEDIMNAVKPYLKKYDLTLRLQDEILQIGSDNYIKAKAILTDVNSFEQIVVSASAKEAKEKSKMDASQLTGSASSYARKYALNGLFLLDDVKDSDTDEFTKMSETSENKTAKTSTIGITEKQIAIIKELFADDTNTLVKELNLLGKSKVNELSIKEASDIIKKRKGV